MTSNPRGYSPPWDGGCCCGGDPAGRLGDRPAGNHHHGLAQIVNRHVVEQHSVRSKRQDLFQLGQRIDLDFDLDEMTDAHSRPLHCRANSAGDGDVVVLDQDGIIEAEAMIEPTTGAHGVFFEGS